MTPTFPPSPAQGETAGVSEAVWRVEAEKTLDHLSRFLQKTGAPHAVDWRTWIDNAEQQLAEMRGALELARSHIREHDDHVGDCELSQSDGDAPCSCDYGFTLTQIDVALAPTSQPSRCPTCGGAKALFEPHEPGSTHKIIDCPDCAQPERGKCLRCDNTGAVHRADGEYLGDCPDCAQPERQGADEVDGADTGNAEADRVLRRLASSDPDFDDCTAAAVLIRRLVADMRGPDGFATWKDAAIAERMKRPSPPPTDDIVALIAGLEMIRDKPMSVSSMVISSIADRAIAALKGAK